MNAWRNDAAFIDGFSSDVDGPVTDLWVFGPIGKSEVPLEEPGHLSAVTVAKGIEYGVNLLGSFLEGYIDSNQALAKEAAFGTIGQESLEFARGSFATCSDELNWYEHFQLLMRHPVISAGVQIAAWHHY